MMYIWINLADIDTIHDRDSSICVPLLMVSDCKYLGTFYKVKLDALDEIYLVYGVDDEERAKAMPDAHELIGKKKMKRKVRTRLTKNPPGNTWKNVDVQDERQPVVLIVDGNNLAHRCRHTFSLSYRNLDVSVTYGVLSVLHATMRKYTPDVVVVCWDGGAPAYRYKYCPTYKKRDHSDDEGYTEFLSQLAELDDILPLFGITSVRKRGAEADDLMHHATVLLSGKNILLTSDKDLYQTVLQQTGNVVQVSPTNDKEVTQDSFLEITGVEPNWAAWMTYRAMVGDSSDKVPGVYGIGHKRALPLLEAYGNNPAAIVNAANGIGNPDIPTMGKAVAENIAQFGISGFRNAYTVMRLDKDRCGARKALLTEFDLWEPYAPSEVVAFLKSYAFVSMLDPEFYESFKRLKCPRSLLRPLDALMGAGVRMPLVSSAREALDTSGGDLWRT